MPPSPLSLPPSASAVIRSPLLERSREKFLVFIPKAQRGTKEGPLSRPITRGWLNKVVKLMWDEIRKGRSERGFLAMQHRLPSSAKPKLLWRRSDVGGPRGGARPPFFSKALSIGQLGNGSGSALRHLMFRHLSVRHSGRR